MLSDVERNAVSASQLCESTWAVPQLSFAFRIEYRRRDKVFATLEEAQCINDARMFLTGNSIE